MTRGRRPLRIWSRPGNPGKCVADALGVDEYDFSDALHVIKADAGLGPRDHVSIWSNGDVTDDQGALIGNIHASI